MVLTILRAAFVLLAVYAGFLLYEALTESRPETSAAHLSPAQADNGVRVVRQAAEKLKAEESELGRELSALGNDLEGLGETVTVHRPGLFEESAGLLLMCVGGMLGIAMGIVLVDARTARKSLAAISGMFLGLVVGLAFAYALGLVVNLLVSAWWPDASPAIISTIKLVIGVVSCYLVISLIIQTKDDIRFVIPYVEFAKQTKGPRPMLLDTSVIIDGRIADIAESRLIESPMIVPRFVLQELQAIADSSDKLKRNRGRRGLDVLNRLQGNDKIDVSITDTLMVEDEVMDVDHQLVALGKKIGAKVATNDYNLNKIAQLQGVEVINVNDLASALRPVVLPGEQVEVKVIKPGEEVGQGIGYLEDGTMVVGEQCRDMIGQEVSLTVTSVLQTSAGRMIFGRREDAGRGRKG